MLEGLNSAAAGMAAQQQRLDSVANDLANANTTGYKHGRVGFRDLIYEQAGRPAADGVRTGHGAAAVALVAVRSTQGLTPIDDNAFHPSAPSGPAVVAPRASKLTQGALEAS